MSLQCVPESIPHLQKCHHLWCQWEWEKILYYWQVFEYQWQLSDKRWHCSALHWSSLQDLQTYSIREKSEWVCMHTLNWCLCKTCTKIINTRSTVFVTCACFAEPTSSCPINDFNNSPHRNKILSIDAQWHTDLAGTFSNSVATFIEVHLNSWRGNRMDKRKYLI